MEEKIITYLKEKTNKENIWVNIDFIVTDFFPNLTNDPQDIGKLFLFENHLLELIRKGTVRIQEDDQIGITNNFKVALESNIEKIINEKKLSAIDDMKKELKDCITKEKYEDAAEYRDMITEYENKVKLNH